MLTAKQRMALTALAQVDPMIGYLTPAEIGDAMGGTKRGHRQGCGRIGSSMAHRLIKLGLVKDISFLQRRPAYRITDKGREAIK